MIYWWCYSGFNVFHFGWFRMVDESTLRGGQKCCHIVLFSRCVYVWNSTMVILKHIFPNILHNMVSYNTKNSITNKIPFPTYIVWFQNIFMAKKCTSLYTKNCKYTQKNIEMIFSIYEISSIYKHCGSIWLE
jgi:hypothetical protein